MNVTSLLVQYVKTIVRVMASAVKPQNVVFVRASGQRTFFELISGNKRATVVRQVQLMPKF
jgi:hypothetical protein